MEWIVVVLVSIAIVAILALQVLIAGYTRGVSDAERRCADDAQKRSRG